MELTEEILEEIDRYLNDEMSIAERTAFEQRVDSNEDLHAYLKAARLEHAAVEFIIKQNLQQKFQAWDKEMSSNTDSVDIKRSMWRDRLSLVLLILLGTGLIFWFFPFENDVPVTVNKGGELSDSTITVETPVNVSADTFSEQPYPPPTVSTPIAATDIPDYADLAQSAYALPDMLVRSAEAQQDSLSHNELALRAVNEKEYASAIKLIEQSDNNADHFFILAHAHFGEGNYKQAAQYFGELLAQSRFNRDEYEWYLCLAILAQSSADNLKGIDNLEAIAADGEHNFNQSAKDLLEQITQ